jgi:hypothetical protein
MPAQTLMARPRGHSHHRESRVVRTFPTCVIAASAALTEVTSGYEPEQHHEPYQSEQWESGHSKS